MSQHRGESRCDRSEKASLKSLETPEQKQLQRFAKKEAKEQKRKEQMGRDEEFMGYTNTDNPFGDTNLSKSFVWSKKLEKEGLKNITKDEIGCRNRMKLEENRVELEKVKQRRLEREREWEACEEERTRIQREEEAAQFKEWEKQEDTFHLQQAKLRSKIRIQDDRVKPIDLLARYVSAEDEDLTVEMHKPYEYLNDLKIQDLEDLQEDIKIYMDLENGKNLEYWKDLQIIVEDEMHKLRKVNTSGTERREGINAAVGSEIVSIFKGKTLSQLQVLYQHIEKKISGGEEGIDVGYWETLLSRLKAYMARARLQERCQENLRNRRFQRKLEQGVERSPLFPSVASTLTEVNVEAGPSTCARDKINSTMDEDKSKRNEKDDSSQTEEIEEEPDPVKMCEKEYISGRYSPVLICLDRLEPGILLCNPVEDAQMLGFMREHVRSLGSDEGGITAQEKAFEQAARKGMDADEAIFSVEFNVGRTYLWSDKYRPRKPRYFNRVHTGFEWNKYNQTHYDVDNPPPKLVQGYKFNIFYPDVIDKAKTPEYTLTPSEENEDFAILKFHAGPPYEDIAFKIANREWEYSYKRGFRCQFYSNIFQLWFPFKRYRYRR